MSVTILSSALLVASLSPQANDLENDAKRYLSLTEVDVQRLDVPEEVRPALVEFEVNGLDYSMDIRPHSIRSADYMLQVDVNGTLLAYDGGESKTFRGDLLEDPGSVVAASLLQDGLYAKVVFSSGEVFWIEPLVSRVPGARQGQYAVYDQRHVIGSSGFCGTDTSGHVDFHTTDGDAGIAGLGAYEIAELGIDADFEFYQDHNSNVNQTSDRMELVLNTMNTQYENEVGITHVISAAIVRTTSGSPYTSSNPGTLLGQFANHWNSAQSGLRRDVAHLFTGKNLDGSVIGVAYLGVICTNSAYGLVQSDCCGSLSCAADLSAHEIGHNWNAGHCNCSSYTMNSSLTCSNQFTNGTENSIISHRNSRNCLDDGTILFEDDFESSNFSAGGWTVSSSTRCKVRKSSAYTGLRGAKLKKGGQGSSSCTVGTDETWIHTPSISTVGFSSVQLQMHAHFRKNELNCEFLDMQVSVNGGAWNSFGTLEKHAWDYYRLNLPNSAAGQNDVRVRFVTNAKGAQERADIDNVRIIGF